VIGHQEHLQAIGVEAVLINPAKGFDVGETWGLDRCGKSVSREECAGNYGGTAYEKQIEWAA
jgi:hypothetical protein